MLVASSVGHGACKLGTREEWGAEQSPGGAEGCARRAPWGALEAASLPMPAEEPAGPRRGVPAGVQLVASHPSAPGGLCQPLLPPAQPLPVIFCCSRCSCPGASVLRVALVPRGMQISLCTDEDTGAGTYQVSLAGSTVPLWSRNRSASGSTGMKVIWGGKESQGPGAVLGVGTLSPPQW